MRNANRDKAAQILRLRAGAIECQESADNKRLVTVYESGVSGHEVDTRYAVVCESHGDVHEASTLAEARALRTHPTEWCDGCVLEVRLMGGAA